VHLTDTDIIYVLEGSATVVTGGHVLEPHEQSPVEIRGSAIEGGDERQIGKGDVLTIPNGVPHWFKTVRTPFRYYVIKSVGEQASTAERPS
jgi:quercetin dioxygenase-like cupin family protein